VVQILFATRTLGLSGSRRWACPTPGLGVARWRQRSGGNRISRRLARALLVLGVAVCGAGWALLSVVAGGALGVRPSR